MIERGYGRIINVASLSSLVALYEVAAYGASKAALASLTKSLAIEWAPYGVCVNAIVPGVFRTRNECRPVERYAPRPGIPPANTDAPVWDG
jgi:NAD(P)-dependent dehydrogenase (short-subunit alcohol dehydrogenase family)